MEISTIIILGLSTLLLLILGGKGFNFLLPKQFHVFSGWMSRTARIVLYSNPIVGALRSRYVQVPVAAIVPSYYLCLDVFGSRWKLINEYMDFHTNLFLGLLIATSCLIVIRSVADWYESKSDSVFLNFTRTFLQMLTKALRHKIRLIHENSHKITKSSNQLSKLFDPAQQINLLITEVEGLISSQFDIPLANQLLTIICVDGGNSKSYYKFRTKQWNLESAKKIMEGTSLAAECLRKNEPLFCFDKKSLLFDQYIWSEKDKEFPEGSMFCYPIKAQSPTYVNYFVLSISTYGRQICPSHNDKFCEAVKQLLIDIGHRFELELNVLTMTNWLKESRTAVSSAKQPSV